MKRDSKMLAIDSEKLRNTIKQINLNAVDVSRKLGFSDNYISKCCSRGAIKESSANMLDIVYGIKYDDIKPDPVIVPEPETEKTCNENDQLVDILKRIEPSIVPVSYGELEASIRNGVSEGIMDIINDIHVRSSLFEMMKNAYKQALKENLKERIAEQSGKRR